MSEKKPDKMDKNIIILFEKKSFIRFNLFKLLSYSFKLLFSSKNLSLKISSLASFAEIAANNLLNKVEISKLKTLLMPYEGQPFQKEIIDTVRKKNNDIKIIGYDHSAPPPLPLNLNYDFLSPDILLINGSNQLKFYSKYLKWPKKKLKFVPSIRFQNEDKKKFEKKIFLPYQIVDKKLILNEFNSLIKKNQTEYLGNFNIKNHPHSQNSNIHHELTLELKNLINKNYKKKSKKISKPSAFFIGQTTAVILALEMGLVSYHICFNPITDSYTNTLWKNIKVTQLSDYTFKYELSKRNAFVNLKKEKNLFKKYYDSKI